MISSCGRANRRTHTPGTAEYERLGHEEPKVFTLPDGDYQAIVNVAGQAYGIVSIHGDKKTNVTHYEMETHKVHCTFTTPHKLTQIARPHLDQRVLSYQEDEKLQAARLEDNVVKCHVQGQVARLSQLFPHQAVGFHFDEKTELMSTSPTWPSDMRKRILFT